MLNVLPFKWLVCYVAVACWYVGYHKLSLLIDFFCFCYFNESVFGTANATVTTTTIWSKIQKSFYEHICSSILYSNHTQQSSARTQLVCLPEEGLYKTWIISFVTHRHIGRIGPYDILRESWLEYLNINCWQYKKNYS